MWLCAAATLVAAVPPARGGELERKRDEAKRRQSEVRKQLDLAQASEAQLTRRLAEIEEGLADRRSEAEAARADSEEAAASVERIAAEVESSRARLTQRRMVFNRRAVVAYMGGDGRPLDELNLAGELFSLPEDFTEAARRTELVHRVSSQDGDVLSELTDAQTALARDELTLTLTRNRAVERAADAERAVRAVAALKREQEATHAALQERITALQAEADALAAEQARLETLIRERLAAAARARAARGRSPFVGRRTGGGVSAAGFIWPVQGVITSGFGPRWGRMHTGIDIAARSGIPIAAAKEGEVIYADWLGGYGQLVAVDHGDSVVTLYAHQSRMAVAEGQEVTQGQVVGYVGTTGHSTGNHLHFEVRIDARPRDPRPYLP
ncbi:MAG: peptidoglycan DD-metalloendopeptidase family protein [Actinomycetota bacterium]|nr:peptidoglycan DD-metalloendopeptidase family protein [Actinomycetota bacterium]